eukprot:m.80495 g.80495  ORF g.80495 m.80495 type:complete len:83 (-) comp50691_c0_seq1:819-1067(-)
MTFGPKSSSPAFLTSFTPQSRSRTPRDFKRRSRFHPDPCSFPCLLQFLFERVSLFTANQGFIVRVGKQEDFTPFRISIECNS